MMKLPMLLAVSALLAVPMAAQAVIYQFTAALSGAKEVAPPVPVPTATTGVATLFYDNMGTAALGDDTYSFSMSVFGLTGAATAFHIHGAATTAENAPSRVSLHLPPFVSFNMGSTLLVGGSGVAAPVLFAATPATVTNAGHPAMSFLDMLRGGLAYVNVHTAANPAGAVRGQLIEVSVVPEPSTYALLLAGIGMMGMLARRRRG